MTQPSYDESKFVELVLYVARRCESDSWFGAVKLHKLLYYAEFGAFRKLGEPISGAVFQNLEHGPAAKRLLPIQDKLLEAGYAEIDRVPTVSGVQKRLIAKREPDLARFSREELDIIDAVIREHWGKTATQIRRESHEEPGWLVTTEREEIPYEMALLSRPAERFEDDPSVLALMEERRDALPRS